MQCCWGRCGKGCSAAMLATRNQQPAAKVFSTCGALVCLRVGKARVPGVVDYLIKSRSGGFLVADPATAIAAAEGLFAPR